MLRNKYVLARFIAVATFIIYLFDLRHEFITWDDGAYIIENRYIRSLDIAFFKWAFFDFYAFNWHPLTWISHALDYAVWGLNPLGHHLTNNILHAINTYLVVILTVGILETAKERTTQAKVSSFLTEGTMLITGGVAGLLFGLHPLHVESVVWVSERKDLLCGLFFLLSIIQYMRYIQSMAGQTTPRNVLLLFSDKSYLLTFVFFLLALLSKPMAVTLPIVLLILDWYPLYRATSLKAFRSVLIEKLPFIALSLASSIVTILAQHNVISSVGQILLEPRLMVAAKSLLYYLWKMVWPLELVPFYPYPNPKEVSLLSFEYLSGIILVSGITMACIASSKKQRAWLTAWGYYVVTLLPVIGIIQVGRQSMADRYTYLPSLGPFILLGLGSAWLYRKGAGNEKSGIIVRHLGSVAAIFIFIAISFLTIKQIGVWKTSSVFWNYVIEKEPAKSYIPYANRGLVYKEEGLLDQAIEQYLIAIQLGPASSDNHRILGAAYELKGLLDQAIEQYQIAVRLAPEDVTAHHDLGVAFEKKGELDEAIGQYQILVKLDPDFAPAYNNLGAAYQKRGLIDKAIEQYRIAASLDPNYGLAHNNLGAAYESKGLIEQAVEQYQIAVKLDPNYALPYNNLGAVYMKKGLLDQAIEQYRIAIRLAPGYVRAHNNLGETYLKKGLLEQAVEQFQFAIKLDPNDLALRKNLADAYEKKRRSR